MNTIQRFAAAIGGCAFLGLLVEVVGAGVKWTLLTVASVLAAAEPEVPSLGHKWV